MTVAEGAAFVQPYLFAAVDRADWIAAIATLVATLIAAPLSRRFTVRLARRAGAGSYASRWLGRIIVLVVVLLGTFYVATLLEIQPGPLLGALGISGIVVALALQSVFANLLGGVMLNATRPFHIGDQITSGDHIGTVVDISTRSTEILSYNNNHIFIPNADVLAKPIINWTRDPQRRTIMPITLGYDVDLPAAKRALAATLRQNPLIDEVPAPEVVATGFGDSGVNVTLKFWHASEYLVTQAAIDLAVNDVLVTCREEGISIAYPVVELHRGD